MNQGNTARNAKVQFLKMFFWIPFIAVIVVIFPISRRPNSRYRGTATTAIYPCAWWGARGGEGEGKGRGRGGEGEEEGKGRGRGQG